MDWIRDNWFFILFFVIFIWMHMSGHGCGGHGHGGHGHGKKASPEGSPEGNHLEKKNQQGG